MTPVIICVFQSEINLQQQYQRNLSNLKHQQATICVLYHLQKNEKILLVAFERHGIYLMLQAQSMINTLDFNVQNRTLFHNGKRFFSFVLLANCDTASHYLMLVSMVAITMLKCQLTPVLVQKQKHEKQYFCTVAPK